MSGESQSLPPVYAKKGFLSRLAGPGHAAVASRILSADIDE